MKLQNATVTGRLFDLGRWRKSGWTNGSPGGFRTADSLLRVAACPRAWLRAGIEADTATNPAEELLWAATLIPAAITTYIAVRPETYEAVVPACPKCGSEGPAPRCRKCDAARRKKRVDRSWHSGSAYCAAWEQSMSDKGLLVCTTEAFAKAQAAAGRLHEESAAHEILTHADRALGVAGLLEVGDSLVGVRALIGAVPPEDSPYGDGIVLLRSMPSVAPRETASILYRSGVHAEAALARDLYNSATGACRTKVYMILSERTDPYEPGFRVLSKSFLALGATAYGKAASRYEQCVRTGKYPGHDDAPEGTIAWGQVDEEPWMV